MASASTVLAEPPLKALFQPRSVAVIGASERPGSVGLAIMSNLLARPFGGPVHPVNPGRSSVLGRPSFASIAAVPGPVDLAVIATPAFGVPDLVRQCSQAGVKACVIVSAGFRETGGKGRLLEEAVNAARGGMRVLGPNCLGVMVPPFGLNATFARSMAPLGSVAFLSQSGALLSGILDWSLKEGFGFSAVLSLGSMLDLGWGEAIEYLGSDDATRSILLYMESIGEARPFLKACAKVAPRKPIILLKSGRSAAGARAAASHTGALVESDAVLDAALRRCGVVRVDTVAELFLAAEALDLQPQPKGGRLAIITNAGGPGVLAADALERGGGELAPLNDATLKALDKVLPPNWSRSNPVDMLGDAGPEQYAKAVELLSQDPSNQGLLVVLTPQFMTDPDGVARRLASMNHKAGKPIFASFIGGSEVAKGVERLKSAGIPCFRYPDAAARMFCQLWHYRQGLALEPLAQPSAPSPVPARQPVIEEALAAGHALLSEQEAKALLGAYGIPVAESAVAESGDEAVQLASRLGYPVALKLHSHAATHKSELGGVKLNLQDKDDVRRAFVAIRHSVEQKAGPGVFEGVNVQRMAAPGGHELILGCSSDPNFGPVLLLGLGGTQVELFGDAVLALPPLDAKLARSMIRSSRVSKLLKGWRGGQGIDEGSLMECLCAFSRLVLENPRIKEIEINPLLAGPGGLLALDARAALFGGDVSDAELPGAALLG